LPQIVIFILGIVFHDKKWYYYKSKLIIKYMLNISFLKMIWVYTLQKSISYIESLDWIGEKDLRGNVDTLELILTLK